MWQHVMKMKLESIKQRNIIATKLIGLYCQIKANSGSFIFARAIKEPIDEASWIPPADNSKAVDTDTFEKIPWAIPEASISMTRRLIMTAEETKLSIKNMMRASSVVGYLNLMMKIRKVNAAAEIRKV